MMKSTRLILSVVIMLLMVSCKSEYQTYVDKELARSERFDSLIFGMHIGQTRKDFYGICWELNNQEILTQGSGNTTVRYIDRDHEISDSTLRKDLLFYGIFDEKNIMVGMDMSYSYVSWAPWNKALQADSLAHRLTNIVLEKYGGNEFIEINLKDLERKAFVKIDGNRQILIYPKNNKDVVVKMEDLHHKLEAKTS